MTCVFTFMVMAVDDVPQDGAHAVLDLRGRDDGVQLDVVPALQAVGGCDLARRREVEALPEADLLG